MKKYILIVWLALVSIFASAQTNQYLQGITNVFIGTPLAGLGDTAYNAFAKVNNNTTVMSSNIANIYLNEFLSYSEFYKAGVAGNLVDYAGFSSFSLMTNTFRGTNISFYNYNITPYGVWCTNGTLVQFAENLSPTNTIIINWWEDYKNTNTLYGNLFQSINTSTTNGEGFTYWGSSPGSSYVNVGQSGQENVWGYGGATVYPISGSGYTNLVYGTLGNLGAGFQFQNLQRHTTAISCDGQGHIYVYEDGQLMQYYQSLSSSILFSQYPTNNMNLMSLGGVANYSGLPNNLTNGFNGYIESIGMFNCVLTTNLYEAWVFASDWLQPFTTRRIFVADSRGTTPNASGSIPVLLNTLMGKTAMPINQNQGGTTLEQFSRATNIISFFPPHGKVTDEIAVLGGVNNVYAEGENGPTMFNALTNWIYQYVNSPGYTISIWDIYQVWTNGSVYAQTQIGWSNSMVYNSMVYQNRNLFKNIYQESGIVSQEMMNTNRNPQISPDGLHAFNATNGPAFNLMLCGLTLEGNSGIDPLMISNENQHLFPAPIPVYIASSALGTNNPQTNSFLYTPDTNNTAWTPWSWGLPSLGDIFYGGGGNINDTAQANTAIGAGSMTSVYAGNGNSTALGFDALQNISSGAEDEAIGSHALYNVTSAQQDIGIGYTTLYYVQSSDYNIGIGFQALGQLANAGDSGNYIKNIAIGAGAGYNNTTAQYDIYLGSSGVNGETSITRIGIEGDTLKTILYGGIQPQAAFGSGNFISTNGGAGVSQSFNIQTNSTGPHGWTMLITNGIIVGETPY